MLQCGTLYRICEGSALPFPVAANIVKLPAENMEKGASSTTVSTRLSIDVTSGHIPRAVDPSALRLRLCTFVILVDAACLLLAFFLAGSIQPIVDNWTGIAAAVVPIYLAMALNANAFRIECLRRTSQSIASALVALALTFGSLFLLLYFLRTEQELSRLLLIMTMATSAVFLAVWRATMAALIRHRMEPLTAELLIVHDMSIETPVHTRVIQAMHHGLEPNLRDPAMLHRFAELVARKDRVIIACRPEWREAWAMMLKGANVQGEVIVDDIGMVGAIGMSRFGRHTTLTVSTGPLKYEQRVMKRLFDLALCIPMLMLLAPVLTIVAIAIKLDSPGPVLFRQRRVGRGNALFEILKFRSMKVEQTDANGNRSASRDDDRITRVGRILRRTSFDELPQLLNVLGGSMSLVGPRPHALGSLAGEQLFWEVDQRYWHRHVLKPGITGLAQVRGLRGATVCRTDLTRRLQADLEYAASWSLWKDIVILVSTVKVIVHENSY